MKIEEIAKLGGFEKRKNKWWNEFYLKMLDLTPYQLGDSVYISDGVYADDKGMTNKELLKYYEENPTHFEEH